MTAQNRTGAKKSKKMSNVSSKTTKALTAQIRGQLECILGACTHTPTSKTCLYWNKVVDSDDPAAMQYKLIEKLFKRVAK